MEVIVVLCIIVVPYILHTILEKRRMYEELCELENNPKLTSLEKLHRLKMIQLKIVDRHRVGIYAGDKCIDKYLAMERRLLADCAMGEEFVIVKYPEIDNTLTIVYDHETKVMYAASVDKGGVQAFTPLINADGTPRIYDGDTKREFTTTSPVGK